MVNRLQATAHMYEGRSMVSATNTAAASKPAGLSATPFRSDWLPISVSELTPGTTHRGRVLRGRVIEVPMVMRAIMTVIEDERGDVTLVRMLLRIDRLGGPAGRRTCGSTA